MGKIHYGCHFVAHRHFVFYITVDRRILKSRTNSNEYEDRNVKVDENKYFLAYLRRIQCIGGGLVTNPYISSRIKTTVNYLYTVHWIWEHSYGQKIKRIKYINIFIFRLNWVLLSWVKIFELFFFLHHTDLCLHNTRFLCYTDSLDMCLIILYGLCYSVLILLLRSVSSSLQYHYCYSCFYPVSSPLCSFTYLLLHNFK